MPTNFIVVNTDSGAVSAFSEQNAASSYLAREVNLERQRRPKNSRTAWRCVAIELDERS